jgi:hypothetical protein
MTKREKLLAVAVAVVVCLWGGNWLWGKYSRSLEARRTELIAARQRLVEARVALNQGQAAIAQLAAWQEGSLPADRETAQSLYGVWLENQCKAAGLDVQHFGTSANMVPTAGYSPIGYTITARGTLKSLTNFLDAYYRNPLLQQITRLHLRPEAGGAQLNIDLAIEALILPGTSNDTLPEGVADRLAKTQAADYAKSIGDRNLFAAYRPPRPEPPPTVARPAPPPPPKFDDAKFAYFTGYVQVGSRPQAWINVRTTNETLRLFEGDDIKVGLFDGKVVSIEPRAISVKSGDQELRVKLGDNLRDGKALTPKADAG